MASLERTLRERLLRAPAGAQEGVRAELAGCLARLGRFDEARQTLEAIAPARRWGDPLLASRYFLAQGLVALADEFSSESRDRLRRAHAVAQLAGLGGPAATAAAWLAHHAFNQGQFEEMGQWQRMALREPAAVEPMARMRLLLMLANAWRHACEFATSDRFYASAREHAVREGDGAFIASGLYNRAVYGIARLRLLDAAGTPVDSPQVQQAVLELDSATHYAKATDNASATELQSLWRARLAMLQGRAAEALPALQQAAQRLPEARHERLALSLQGDLACCQAQLGDAGAGQALQQLDPLDAAILETDDRVVFLAQLEGVARRVGRDDVASAIHGLRLRAQEAHRTESERLVQQLHALDVPADWFVASRAAA